MNPTPTPYDPTVGMFQAIGGRFPVGKKASPKKNNKLKNRASPKGKAGKIGKKAGAVRRIYSTPDGRRYVVDKGHKVFL